MTSLESTTAVTASIVPFDPAVGVTAVASVALTLFVVFMLVLAFSSTPSGTDSAQPTGSPQGGSGVETTEPTD